MTQENHEPRGRITYLDTAKAIGIFLVFYGHLLEEFAGLGSQAAFPQYKFVYSFHMPFFFILAGFFYRQKYASLRREIRDAFYKRILPVFLFGLMVLPLWPLYRYLIWGYVDIPIFSEKVLPYLKGQPELNPITWFLVCLFTTEIMARLVLPKIKRPLWGMLAAGVFLAGGLYLTYDIKQAELLFGIYKNTWYIHEALVACGLYMLGYFSFPYLKAMLQWKGALRLVFLAIFLGITLLTFDLNRPYADFVVIMKESWHGNSGWFLLTAISGSLLLLLLSTCIPQNKILDFVGQNTLILLGINGIFHTFINVHISTKVENLDSVWLVTLVSLAAALVSMLVSAPAIIFLNRFLPQLVGKPYQKGPWLPGFER